MNSMKFLYLSVIVSIAVLGQMSLKKGLSGLGHLRFSDFLGGFLGALSNPYIIFAFACYGAGLLFYLFLLSRYDLSNIYPVTSGMTLAAITVFGAVILKEPFLWNKILGVFLIAAGIFFLER